MILEEYIECLPRPTPPLALPLLQNKKALAMFGSKPPQKHTNTFAIIGLGTFGKTVAEKLTQFGNCVIGIDIDAERVADCVDSVTHSIILDSRDEKALREAGIGDCSFALIAVGTRLEASILTAINLKTIGVPVIWAKATSKTHHRILSKMSVDRVLHPESAMGQHVAQVIHNPQVKDYVSLGNGYHVVNFQIAGKLEDKALSDLPMLQENNLRCLGAMRGTAFLGREGDDERLQKDDLLILLGRRADLFKFAESL